MGAWDAGRVSIPVQPDQLAAVIDGFGSAMLVTLPAEGFPRVLTCDPVLDEIELVVPDPFPVALAHVAARPAVSLVWPAVVHHGYALIVDGYARVEADELRVEIDHAVLHRPRAHRDGPAWVFPDAR